MSLDIAPLPAGAASTPRARAIPSQTVNHATVNGTPLALDVYLPRARPATPGRAGAGGSRRLLVRGREGRGGAASRRLADLGFTVFDVQYRISPQPNWQTATGDVKCAIGWVKQHADTPDWNVDPKKVTLLGRSAGGHLALMAAYTPTDPELPASCDAADTSVEAVISLYAPTDLALGLQVPGQQVGVGQPRQDARVPGRRARTGRRSLPRAVAARARDAGGAAHAARPRRPRSVRRRTATWACSPPACARWACRARRCSSPTRSTRSTSSSAASRIRSWRRSCSSSWRRRPAEPRFRDE